VRGLGFDVVVGRAVSASVSQLAATPSDTGCSRSAATAAAEGIAAISAATRRDDPLGRVGREDRARRVTYGSGCQLVNRLGYSGGGFEELRLASTAGCASPDERMGPET
jgi:hypothetical protein